MSERIAQGALCKVDEDRRLVYGWAYVAKRASGEQVVDHSGDFVDDMDGLDAAAVDYVLDSREGDEMHRGPVAARLVESIVFTPAKIAKMGLAPDAMPLGWWVGFRIDSDETWGRVKAGQLPMFSIYGAGEREAVSA